MEQIRLAEIAAAIGCKTSEDAVICDISTDSRALPQGCLFIALEGERFDGHDYVASALDAGAAFAVVHHDCETGEASPLRLLRVGNTQDALLAIARIYRARYDLHCVGVTGSVGKTTTKDMIAAVVSAGFKTLKTEGNLNNEIGLPKTLLGLDRSYRAAVIEMGMQGLGEIAVLAAAAQPTVGVITNVGVSHLEQLGTRENILKAKLELADSLPDGAPLLLCADNDLLREVQIARLSLITYGTSNPNATLRATDITVRDGETAFRIVCSDPRLSGLEEGTAVIPCVGAHNLCNALAALAVGRLLGIGAKDCLQALQSYTPSGMRQRIVAWKDCTVVEDCYNASPDSMRAAMQTLASYACTGKRIAVLGDMLELGAVSKKSHFDVGYLAAEEKVELLLAYGLQARGYLEGAREGGIRAEHFTEKEKLVSCLRKAAVSGSVIWVKGSRGMRMEEILEDLYQD